MLDDPQIMTTLLFITLFLCCPCRSGCWSPWPLAGDQCQPQSRQSDRGLLNELESLVTHRDRGQGDLNAAGCLASLGLGSLLIQSFRNHLNPTRYSRASRRQPSIKDITQRIVNFCACTPLNPNPPVPRAGTMSCFHHVIPGETEAMVQQVISKKKKKKVWGQKQPHLFHWPPTALL